VYVVLSRFPCRPFRRLLAVPIAKKQKPPLRRAVMRIPQDSGFAGGPSLDLPSPEFGLDKSSYSSFMPVLCGAKRFVISML
jgi:hypothetical protein